MKTSLIIFVILTVTLMGIRIFVLVSVSLLTVSN